MNGNGMNGLRGRIANLGWIRPDGSGPQVLADDAAGDPPSEPSPEKPAPKPSAKPKNPFGDSRPPRSDGPRNPWLPGGDGKPTGPEGPRRSASIEDIFRGRTNRGGPGGGGGPGMGGGLPRFPTRPGGGSWLPVGIAAIALLWVGSSTVHFIKPQDKGVVATFGSYTRTLGPGMAFTLPWPIQTVKVRDVTSIRRDSIPEGDGERLMLTSDQNLVDISYLVRWNIKDLKLFTYQLADPEQTVREVAEAAMRQSIAEETLAGVMGGGRAQIEANMRERMQAVLDAYRAGVKIQGVEIKKTDPPEKVKDAFKEVSAAQQDAQSSVNRAQAWAQQLTASAQGEAAAFDKVYGQYKLAPEVTKRRLYYETMERVLSQTDKVIIEAPGTVPYLPLPQMKTTPPPADAPTTGGK
jgi:membrane protease subunit HflK